MTFICGQCIILKSVIERLGVKLKYKLESEL